MTKRFRSNEIALPRYLHKADALRIGRTQSINYHKPYIAIVVRQIYYIKKTCSGSITYGNNYIVYLRNVKPLPLFIVVVDGWKHTYKRKNKILILNAYLKNNRIELYVHN